MLLKRQEILRPVQGMTETVEMSFFKLPDPAHRGHVGGLGFSFCSCVTSQQLRTWRCLSGILSCGHLTACKARGDGT